MSASFGAAGTAATNATRTVAPDISSFSSGDYMIAVAAYKYGDRVAGTPSGWTLLASASGGAGTDGTTDEGQAVLFAFGREKDGTEGSTVSISDTGGTANCLGARVFSFTKGAGETWDVVGGAVASDNTAGTALTWTYDTDPGITAGDIAVTPWVINSDAYTHTHALSCSGLSSITTNSRGNTAITAGANLRYGLVTHIIGAGTATDVATYTNTASGSATNAPAGASVLIRVRATAAGVSGSATAALTLAASATGTVPRTGVVSAALALAVAAVGVIGSAPNTGSATAALALDVAATGTVPIAGTASTVLPFDVTATGTVPRTGTASGPLILSVAAGGVVGTAPNTGSATCALALDVGAAGTVAVRGTAAAILPIDVTATGTVAVRGAATVLLPLDVAATGTTPRTGSALASLLLDVGATGTVTTGVPYAGQVRVTAARGPSLTFYAGHGASLTFTPREPEA